MPVDTHRGFESRRPGCSSSQGNPAEYVSTIQLMLPSFFSFSLKSLGISISKSVLAFPGSHLQSVETASIFPSRRAGEVKSSTTSSLAPVVEALKVIFSTDFPFSTALETLIRLHQVSVRSTGIRFILPGIRLIPPLSRIIFRGLFSSASILLTEKSAFMALSSYISTNSR